jgi:aldehyde:ferredoxin oxidoreductase
MDHPLAASSSFPVIASLATPAPRAGLLGWRGRLLAVDLSARALGVIELPDDVLRRCAGGRALAAHLLGPSLHADWAHPDAPLLLLAGPLTGLPDELAVPGCTRGLLAARSPRTGTTGDDTFGGGLAARLRRAGWDGVAVTGRSSALLGLELGPAGVRLVDAEPLRGRTTDATFRALGMGGHGEQAAVSALCIGPAGEARSLLAGVLADGLHSSGRGGLGACFGAKGLKFVSAASGPDEAAAEIPVADRAALAKVREDILRLTMASPALMGELGFTRYGTPALYDLAQHRAMLPTDNFRRARFEAGAGLGACAWDELFAPEPRGCLGCHVRCRRVAVTDEGARPLPSFEPMAQLTALLGNADPGLALEAYGRALALGLEPDAAAATLACAMEISGELGLPRERLLAALEEMARGPEGLGAGAARYARSRGASQSAMTVKGLELPPFDPRGAWGTGLSMAVATCGGTHRRALALSHEMLRKPVATDRFSLQGKARMVKTAEDAVAAFESVGACTLFFLAAGLEEYARALAAATGEPCTAGELAALGERACQAERALNLGAGVDPQDDDLPARFFQPSEDGAPPLNRAAFLEARQRYWRLRGLGPGGRPAATPQPKEEPA